MKSRISGSSISTQNVGEEAQKLLYTTNSHSVHKKFGKVEAPDMEKIAAQKLRLSQSNFHMG